LLRLCGRVRIGVGEDVGTLDFEISKPYSW